MLLDKWGQPFRNDEAQRLMNKYTRVCREEGLANRDACIQAVANLNKKEIAVGVDAIAMVATLRAHQFAGWLLETPEFRPLVNWWVGKEADNSKKQSFFQRLVDMGALEYQRAIAGQ